MKQVLQSFRSGVLKVDEVPDTIVRPGGVLVRTAASLISPGTERMTVELAQKSLLGKARERPDLVRQVITKVKRDGVLSTLRAVEARLDAPLAMGYSAAGEVVEVGRGAEEFRIGDRVACAGMNYASHAELIFVPTNLTVRVPEGVSYEEASFVTLGAIALQGIRVSEARLGETVAVIGLGLLGQLTVQMLKAAGCRVIGIDLDPHKVELARSNGADLATVRSDDVEGQVSRITDGYGADSVIITAASDSNDPVELAGVIARDRAIVSVIGAVKMDVPRKVFYEKELQLRLSRSYGPGRYDAQYEEQGIDYPISYVRWTERRNMEEFLRLIANGNVKVSELITHKFAIADAENAYEMITRDSEKSLGVVLTYPEAARRPTSSIQMPAVSSAKSAARDNVRLGVIGAGNFARAMLLPRLKKLSGFELVSVATATGRSAKAAAEQFGFRECSTDYRSLISNDQVEAVLIATRHDMHAEITAEALRAKKTVLVEKPLAISHEGLELVMNALQQSDGRLMVGFNRRFSPIAAKVRNEFRGSGPLSMVYRVNAGTLPRESWIAGAEGGGRIVGEICHFVDIFQFFTGADPVEVFARSSDRDSDNLSIVITFSDSSVGNIHYISTGDSGLAKERVEVHAAGRSAVIDDFRTLELWREGKRIRHGRLSQDKGFDGELNAFLAVAQNKAPMPISADSLALTTLTTFAIQRSLETGRPEGVR